jgi:hypothetical protein
MSYNVLKELPAFCFGAKSQVGQLIHLHEAIPSQQAVALSNCNVLSTSCTEETFLLQVLHFYQRTPSSRPMAHVHKLL